MRISRTLIPLRCSLRASRALSSTARTLREVSKPEAPLSPNLPSVDYIGSARIAGSFAYRLTQAFAICGIATVGIGLAGYEGFHQYIERVEMRAPPDDEYGFKEETQGWTGRNGGTDSSLGWRARHAIRAAWISQNGASHDGYEKAVAYLDVALSEAKRREGDLTELLLLKAGALERVGTVESVKLAKDIYEQVIASQPDVSPTDRAKVMRLAAKVGTLCTQVGEESQAQDWWTWGLNKVGDDQNLPPPLLRAAVSLLIAASTHYAKTDLAAAAKAQTTALSLLPPPQPIPPANSAATLHETWLQHRSALLTLHLASTTYAQGKPALKLAQIAATRADNVVEAIDPLPDTYSSFPIASSLRRDALITAAEASYTRGLLLERSPSPPLPLIAELFEKAMTLSALESGSDDGESKYYASFARVKEKLQ